MRNRSVHFAQRPLDSFRVLPTDPLFLLIFSWKDMNNIQGVRLSSPTFRPCKPAHAWHSCVSFAQELVVVMRNPC
jgi:hypothetical protein